MKKMRSHIFFLAGLLLLLAAAGCQTATSSEQAETQPPAPLPLEWVHVASLHPAYEVQLPATLHPFESVALHAKLRGFVKKLYVDRGTQVKKGQLLAVLEAPEIGHQHLSDKAHQDQLMAKYQFSKQSYERLHLAAQRKAGSIAAIELDRAMSQLRSDSAAYISARSITQQSSQQGQYLRILAPFSGTIIRKNLSEGALVGDAGGMPLFELAQNDRLRLSVSLPEIHANSIYENLRAQFVVMSIPNKSFDAVLSRNADLLGSSDRSLALEFDVPNPNRNLRGGDYATVTIPLKRKEATLFVPTTSILTTQSGQYVIQKGSDGKAHYIRIKEGIRQEDQTEIFGAIGVGDSVLLKASEEIQDGQVL